MEEIITFPNYLNYESWVALKFLITSRKYLPTYHKALNEAYTARFDLEQKYSSLQYQFRSLKLEMEKKESNYLSKLDEEEFRNDVLRLQLDLSQREAAEHRDTIKNITEKLQEVSKQEVALTYNIKTAKSELAQKDAEAAILAAKIAEKDSIIHHFEQTCNLLKTNLRKSCEDYYHEITDLKTTISSQSEIILSLSKDLEVQKQAEMEHIKQLETENSAAISEREAMAMEIQMLKIAYKGYQAYVEKTRQENQSLESDVEALIDMSMESEAIGGGYAEENKRLTDQAAIINRELDLIRGVLVGQLSDLRPDLSNLSTVLNEHLRSRKNPKRRCRERTKEIK